MYNSLVSDFGLSKNDILRLLAREEPNCEVNMREDIFISKFSSFPSAEINCLSWFGGSTADTEIASSSSSLLICSKNFAEANRSRFINTIATDYPKFVFALLSNLIQNESAEELKVKNMGISNSAEISGESILGDKVSVGPNSVLLGRVILGDNVSIGANCVIGSPGFGFAKGPTGVYFRIPHIGGVIIGDNVEIGNNVCIDSGTFEATRISKDVKIDNLVHVAHNVVIGERSLITACSEISGSVVVGNDVWIAPNVSIIQKVVIGDGALVGIGSTVTRDVAAGLTVFGSPARALPKKL